MAGGRARDGAVNEQIEASIEDELKRMFAILCPPFPSHNGGPVQMGRLSRPLRDHPAATVADFVTAAYTARSHFEFTLIVCALNR